MMCRVQLDIVNVAILRIFMAQALLTLVQGVSCLPLMEQAGDEARDQAEESSVEGVCLSPRPWMTS